MDFYLILALGPRNGLGYCVVNRHKVKGEMIIIIIIIIIIITITITITITIAIAMATAITIIIITIINSLSTCN